MNIRFALLSVPLIVLTARTADVRVTSVREVTDQRTALRVASGQLDLPSRGVWQVAPRQPDNQPVGQVFLRVPAIVWTALEGERMGELQKRQQLEAARRELYQLYWACKQYANQHTGYGPDRFTDLDWERHRFLSQKDFAERFTLVPGIELPSSENRIAAKDDRQPLAFEIKPELDDGRHWVLWNDGRVERQAVSPDHVARYGLKLEPQRPTREAELAGLGELATYDVFGLWPEPSANTATLTLTNRFTSQMLECSWSVTDASPGEETLISEWARLRSAKWRELNDSYPSLTLSLWLRQAETLYGLPQPGSDQPRGTIGNRTTLFNVLGGRAAIRETLQLQDLTAGADTTDSSKRTVDVETIPGVKVKAHPYDQLLGARDGGRLALAELVPHDRFFCYFPEPKELIRFIDAGSQFVFHLSSGFNQRSISYGLLERYLARMGLTEDTMRGLLESGALSEVGLFLPDLFVIDGTDITVVARLANPSLARPVLRLLGLRNPNTLTVLRSKQGKPVYWIQQQQWLLISTHRNEIESVLALQAHDGKGSLGQSQEFRAMLLQLPIEETSRGYLYFSDPFLRRLTGPAVKIGQLRRVLARGRLEAISAGALLHGLDHPGREAGLSDLLTAGYVPPIREGLSEFQLHDDLRAVSATYGTPADLNSLLNVPAGRATPAEVKAYATYRDNYERFWRQFFDPIAVRFDEDGPNRFRIETFILPLIDSSIYARFREGILTAEEGPTLRVPALHPEPVALLSANLTEPIWVEFLDGIDDWLIRFLGLKSGLLDQLGPSVHLALADADPIINSGSGDLLSSFGTGRGRINDQMFMIPVVVSLLTRPCSLLVEVRDPETVRHGLRQLPTGALPRQGGFLAFDHTLTQVGTRDEWIYGLSIGGMLKLRYGISLQDNYLVISNLPLTHRPTITGVREAANNGLSLRLAPRAADSLLASLYAATVESQCQATLEGLAMLYPILQSAEDDPAAASARHAHLFGFTPVHPPGGEFEWHQGRLTSSRFGHPGAVREPPYSPGDRDFGVLQDIEVLDLSVQFERNGLRAQCAWLTQE